MKKLFTGAALAVAMLSLASCGAYTLNSSEQLLAEAGARDYAERTDGKFVTCSGQDSDGDQYVTCSVETKATSTNPKGQDDLLCSYKSRGCKRK
jgi:hypothetical protein